MMTTLLLIALLILTQTCAPHYCNAFSPVIPSSIKQHHVLSNLKNYRSVVLASESSDETSGKSSEETAPTITNALMPSSDGNDVNTSSSSSVQQPIASSSNDGGDDNNMLTPPTMTTATTAFMITMEQKRVLIEELGYARRDVEAMRVDLAGPIISKRQRCPPEGMPESWYKQEDEESNSMLKRLEDESKYPLKFPLLGISLVLFGKGFSDAIITLIKVNMGYNGVSLTEQFMGIPVLAIDAVCVAAGIGLGVWTWKTMRD